MQTRLIRLLLPALFILLVVACDVEQASESESPDAGDSLQQAQVVRVVDGDTIIVAIDGREERLRYIGIDAPESVTPDAPVECYGHEAAEENRRLVEDQIVYLEMDAENRDRFGRLLRYVYTDSSGDTLNFVNLSLVEDGYAEAGFFPPNERYSDEFFAAERDARSAGAGLWGACR